NDYSLRELIKKTEAHNKRRLNQSMCTRGDVFARRIPTTEKVARASCALVHGRDARVTSRTNHDSNRAATSSRHLATRHARSGFSFQTCGGWQGNYARPLSNGV